jgi:hypothetical protein
VGSSSSDRGGAAGIAGAMRAVWLSGVVSGVFGLASGAGAAVRARCSGEKAKPQLASASASAAIRPAGARLSLR